MYTFKRKFELIFLVCNNVFCIESNIFLRSISRKLGNSGDFQDPESFHRAISFPLALAQFFGIFPVCGVRSKSIKKLRFRKAAPRAIYAYLVIICDFVMAAISLYHMVTRLNTSSIATRGITKLMKIAEKVFFVPNRLQDFHVKFWQLIFNYFGWNIVDEIFFHSITFQIENQIVHLLIFEENITTI